MTAKKFRGIDIDSIEVFKPKKVAPSTQQEVSPVLQQLQGLEQEQLPRLKQDLPWIGTAFDPREKLATTSDQGEKGDIQESKRNIFRSASRAGEAFLGVPGDAIQLGGTLLDVGSRAVGGEGSEILRDVPFAPTSEKIRKNITTPLAEYFGGEGYLDPQSDTQEAADTFFSTVGALLNPIGILGKGVSAIKHVKNAFTTAGMGELAKQFSKQVGAPPWVQEVLKMGTMVVYNLSGTSRAKKIAYTKQNKAFDAIPKGDKLSSKSMKPVIDKLSELKKRGQTPPDWKKNLEHLEKVNKAGGITVEDGVHLVKDLNKAFSKANMPSAFKLEWHDLKKNTWNSLNEYGKKNPTFYNNFREYTDIIAPVLQYESMQKHAKTLEGMFSSTLLKGSLGLIAKAFGSKNPIALLFGLGAHTVVQKMKLLYIMNNNPAIRKVWLHLIKETGAGHINQASKVLKKLNKSFSEIDQ